MLLSMYLLDLQKAANPNLKWRRRGVLERRLSLPAVREFIEVRSPGLQATPHITRQTQYRRSARRILFHADVSPSSTSISRASGAVMAKECRCLQEGVDTFYRNRAPHSNVANLMPAARLRLRFEQCFSS